MRVREDLESIIGRSGVFIDETTNESQGSLQKGIEDLRWPNIS